MSRSHPSVHPVEISAPPLTTPDEEIVFAPRRVRMKDIQGMPGTPTSLALRSVQFAFALVSLAVMATTSDFPSVTAFRYLVAAVSLQVLWSLSLAIVDIYALLVKRCLRNSKVVSLFTIGDGITSTLTFAAACASAGITVLIGNDFNSCAQNHCTRFETATAMAFMSWFAVSPSFFLNFWSLASRMPELGKPSRIQEEEARDIHLVWEAPSVVEPVVAESEPEEDPSEDPETEGDEQEGFSNGPLPEETTFEDDLLEEQADRIMELQDRVEELEAEVHKRQEAGTQMGAIVHHLLTQNVELVWKLEQAEHQAQREKAEKEALRAQLEMKVTNWIQLEEMWEDVKEIVGDLEDEVRGKRRKMNRMGYAFKTGFERWIDGIRYYPAEVGQTHHTMSRDLVIHMGQLEYEDAVRRGMHW